MMNLICLPETHEHMYTTTNMYVCETKKLK